MGEIICYDTRKKKRINRLYQWDRNFSITVEGVPVDPVPVMQFANRFNHITINVVPEVDGTSLVATIPDVLLEQAEPLNIYFYRTNASNSKRTIAAVHIPVRPRMKPGDESIESIMCHYVTFMSEDGSEEYGKIVVRHGFNSPDPIELGMFPVPKKEYTVQWEGQIITRVDYNFDGWSLSPYGDRLDDPLSCIESDMILYAHFSPIESLCAVPYPDINRNGVLDIDDADIIVTAASAIGIGQESGLTSDEEIMADINCDGLIAASDADIMLAFISETESGLYENTPRGWNEYMRDFFNGEKFYAVEFYDGEERIITVVNILRNGGVVYPLETPLKSGVDNPEDYEFVGWYPPPVNVNSNMKCYATFHRR